MAIKKLCRVGLLSTCLVGALSIQAQPANPFGQTIEIKTYLRSVIGNPSWLVIVRNMETGSVLPYVFDFRKENNFWLVLTFSRFYRVTVSNLQFSNDIAISNFCNLENGGIHPQESMSISLSGILSPDPRTSRCIVSRFKPYSFTIVDSADESTSESTPAPTANPLSAFLP